MNSQLRDGGYNDAACLPPLPLVQNPFDKFSTYSEFLVLKKTNAQVLQSCAKWLTGNLVKWHSVA